mmetsp:Transcript_38279/g.108214  ORF Transcript_38279/g.108214 Transcript_38279/m.108214 type:complete len:322 (+) Transcript_38279:285-1250(+)
MDSSRLDSLLDELASSDDEEEEEDLPLAAEPPLPPPSNWEGALSPSQLPQQAGEPPMSSAGNGHVHGFRPSAGPEDTADNASSPVLPQSPLRGSEAQPFQETAGIPKGPEGPRIQHPQQQTPPDGNTSGLDLSGLDLTAAHTIPGDSPMDFPSLADCSMQNAAALLSDSVLDSQLAKAGSGQVHGILAGLSESEDELPASESLLLDDDFQEDAKPLQPLAITGNTAIAASVLGIPDQVTPQAPSAAAAHSRQPSMTPAELLERLESTATQDSAEAKPSEDEATEAAQRVIMLEQLLVEELVGNAPAGSAVLQQQQQQQQEG